MKWLIKHFFSFLLTAIFLAGIGLILYPTVSDWMNNVNQSQAIISYVENVTDMDEEV